MKKILFTAILISALASPVKIDAVQTYTDYFEHIGQMYGICPELLQEIAFCESSFDPNATSGCNAQGLCQIIPVYQESRMKELGVTDLYDPYSNILVCADIIDDLRDKYDDLYLVLMCYNEGEYSGCIDRWKNGNYSEYAINVVEKSYELERSHGK